MTRHDTEILKVRVSAFRIPTDYPEADGTYAWDATTLVLCEVSAADQVGVGYSYADLATAELLHKSLATVALGNDAMDIPGVWAKLVHAVRNLGRPGVCAMAVSALDSALWDLKARLVGVPLVKLLGQVRESVDIYGSGGFTTYSLVQLQKQLDGWVIDGIPRVKMKVGAHPEEDLERVRSAREAIGLTTQLFVDANGAYSRKQALLFAEAVADLGVTWFEEPVSSDDLDGLRLLRDRAPGGMDIAAGEYGFDPFYFRRMLQAQAVDVLQADATRCLGITGFMNASALCQAFCLPLSAHCAPMLHVHPCCAAIPVVHMEYFHDHQRIENMLFEGALKPLEGKLRPDLSRPGNGLVFKHADAKRYEI